MAPAPNLIGREEELGRLLALVRGSDDHGGALVIRGQAGVGKSALLAAAVAGARAQGPTVLEASGVESETRLPFASLQGLLRPFLDRLDRLPEPQRHALEMALGLAPRDAVPDVFLIGLATLGLVTDAAIEAPVLFVVDDAHWIDRASAQVLGFVGRRLEAEPVLMWLAVRAGVPSDVDEAGLPEFELGGLDEEASALLLEAQAAHLAPELERRILAEADGNPLALIELPLAAGNVADGAIPLTARLERAFAGRLGDLDADARALLLAAALEDGEPGELLRAAGRLQGSPVGSAAGDAIVAAGLGTFAPDGFRFRHPLIRSAVEQATPVEERRAAHLALAEVLAGDPDRAVWHRAEATIAPDESVATALAEAGERARLRGGGDAAVAAFERSASLTPDAVVRGLRLWEAAALAWELGRFQDSRRLFSEAQRYELPPFEEASAVIRLESLAGAMSPGDALVGTFTAVVEKLLAAGEVRKALLALEAIAVRAYWGNLSAETKCHASDVARRIDVPRDEPLRLCFLANVDPIRNGREVLEQLTGLSPAGFGDGGDVFAVGQAATVVWADDLALPFLRASADRFRAQGRLGALGLSLASEAWAHLHRGAVVAARTAAAESERLARETGLTLYVPAVTLAEAVALAQLGQADAARALVGEIEAALMRLEATPLLAFVALARGRVELASGHYGAAYERLSRLFDRDDVAFHPFLQGHVLADLVDAAVGGEGDLALVRGHLEQWRQIADDTTVPYLRLQVAYGTAVLSEDDDADRLFHAAVGTARRWPFHEARARLAYGVWLRRVQRRATDARAPLREAAETFTALGQETYAERSLSELRASGETARRRVPEAWAELTPQELQIAQLAAEGLSNKEIGERLYLSHRTVGTHLYHLFPKLGITSRNQLRDVIEPGRFS